MRRFNLLAASFVALSSSVALADGIDIEGTVFDGDWVKVAQKKWIVEGDVQVGDVVLADADLSWHTRKGLKGTASVELELFEGCTLDAPDAALGYAVGHSILDSVPDAPVQPDAWYLFFDVDANTTLDCLGVSIDLAGGPEGAVYLNPHDPSLFVRIADLVEVEDGQLGGLLKQAMNLEVSDAYIGISAQGLVPWVADHPLGDGTPEMDAHVVLGGSFELEKGQLRLGVDNGSVAVDLDDDVVCMSGALYIPGESIPRTDIGVDLPLGAGTVCYDAQADRLDFEAALGGDPWADLDLPAALHELMIGEAFTVSGYATQRGFNVDIEGERSFGPWAMTGSLALSTNDLRFEGQAEARVGGLDLEASVVATFEHNALVTFNGVIAPDSLDLAFASHMVMGQDSAQWLGSASVEVLGCSLTAAFGGHDFGLTFSGAMSVAGVSLTEVSATIGSDGVALEAEAGIGGATVAVDGQLSPAGELSLSGRSTIEHGVLAIDAGVSISNDGGAIDGVVTLGDLRVWMEGTFGVDGVEMCGTTTKTIAGVTLGDATFCAGLGGISITDTYRFAGQDFALAGEITPAGLFLSGTVRVGRSWTIMGIPVTVDGTAELLVGVHDGQPIVGVLLEGSACAGGLCVSAEASVNSNGVVSLKLPIVGKVSLDLF